MLTAHEKLHPTQPGAHTGVWEIVDDAGDVIYATKSRREAQDIVLKQRLGQEPRKQGEKLGNE